MSAWINLCNRGYSFDTAKRNRKGRVEPERRDIEVSNSAGLFVLRAIYARRSGSQTPYMRRDNYHMLRHSAATNNDSAEKTMEGNYHDWGIIDFFRCIFCSDDVRDAPTGSIHLRRNAETPHSRNITHNLV